MDNMKRLPDTEFEIMRVVWANIPPITTNMVMEQLSETHQWKAPTVISFMMRLVEKGFLRTEKLGKERSYFPLISKADYLAFETGNFMEQYHENSLFSFVNTFYNGKKLSAKDLDDLMKLAKEWGE